MLGEKHLGCDLRIERTWERRRNFFRLNPAGTVPVLRDEDGTIVADSQAICEYLDEVYASPSLIGTSPPARAETRRLAAWFDDKFGCEVTANLVDEKVMKRFVGLGEPSSTAIRAGKHNIAYHLDYIAYLTERRRWLAGDDFSLADVTAAAHISAVDYLDDVPWAQHPAAKEWYARVKSRPGFRPLLGDRVPGLEPPAHYDNLDF